MESPTRIWCKICGVTREEDALAAASAGADAVGLNFFTASPRYVATDRAASICARLVEAYPECQRIGLFVDASAEDVRTVVERVNVTMLQFHGDEDRDFCAQFGLPFIKVFKMRAGMDYKALEAQFSDAWALLLDSFDPVLAGGTGVAFDHGLWPAEASAKLVLAGGLNAGNVGAAIQDVRPFGVDVCGGVEVPTKGLKDHQEMQKFIREVRYG